MIPSKRVAHLRFLPRPCFILKVSQVLLNVRHHFDIGVEGTAADSVALFRKNLQLVGLHEANQLRAQHRDVAKVNILVAEPVINDEPVGLGRKACRMSQNRALEKRERR